MALGRELRTLRVRLLRNIFGRRKDWYFATKEIECVGRELNYRIGKRVVVVRILGLDQNESNCCRVQSDDSAWTKASKEAQNLNIMKALCLDAQHSRISYG
jgi:hypothetical protein